MHKWATVAFCLLAIGCNRRHGSAEFASKLAQGCHTEESCDALVLEAETRRALCDSRGQPRCGDAKADLQAALKVREDAARVIKEEADERERVENERTAAQAAAEQAEAARQYREKLLADQAQARIDNAHACAMLDGEIARQRTAHEQQVEAARAENAKRAEAIAWANSRCRKSREAVTERRIGVGKDGVVRVRREVVDYMEVAVCPGNAPDWIVERLGLELDVGRYIADWPIEVLKVEAPEFVPPTDRNCDRDALSQPASSLAPAAEVDTGR